MKIIAIRGKNLASLEGEFEIDFACEPLASAGIFAITGQTGAGKSTVLDALCLALFDDAPRLNRAEVSVNISDVEDKTIAQKDSRNILRRGAGEGYAEVDFKALNGDKYRSRWMVRRARGKADGALQATALKLENLSTDTEEQGTKKNLLDRIVELIGLNFDQFTRAVLLAQGDFANFLKAKQNEKAELLEKLTGTEIYSAISVGIYQKHEDAKKALEIIMQRIRDVKLLSEEELQALVLENEALELELKPLNELSVRLRKQLEWVKSDRRQEEEVTAAGNDLQISGDAIVHAAPRYEYLALLDLSMEIRDVYFDRQEKMLRLQKIFFALKDNETQLHTLSIRFSQADAGLKDAEAALAANRAQYEELKPEIERAKELDFKLSALRDRVAEAKKEVDIAGKKFLETEKARDEMAARGSVLKKKNEELTGWFAERDNCRMVVPKVDLIVNHIAVARSAGLQKENAEKSLLSSKRILTTDQLKLNALEEELARLNELLPAEVLHLRGKLKPDVPCAVCGSTNHPFSSEINQSARINEQQLEAAKIKNVAETNEMKERIEQTKRSVTEFETHILNYKRQYDNVWEELIVLLSDLPDWEEDFRNDRLQNQLSELASQWNANKLLADSYRQETAQLEAKIEAEVSALAECKNAWQEKEEGLKQIERVLNICTEERKQLLGNRTAVDVEKQHSSQIDTHTKRVEKARSEKDELEQSRAKLSGAAVQLKSDKRSVEEDAGRLDKQINDWLNNGRHPVTPGLLADLVTKSKDWIDNERTSLSDLKNKELIARTTLQERKSKLTLHRLSPDKPEEEQTEEALLKQQAEPDERAAAIGKRLAEIKVALLAHEMGREQIKSFDKEKQDKENLFENWSKLNELLGSASGNRFKTIAQGYTLDVLLGYANKHLEDLTRRYRLEKIPGTLALQVSDNDMLGEVRSVHSLSGGESFLISLALALGLSSLSSNRMKIESLFIDEGFGALDIDTLSMAMDALDKLQTQGRKIGVISHVEEMKDRITTQIQVLKSANGKSFVRIVG